MLWLSSVDKSYPVRSSAWKPGIKNVSISVPRGSFVTLLGPSGCGKTTTLRCIAGLEQPDAGTIRIGGDVVFDSQRKIEIPVNHRAIGMVFQSYAIWPHMTVFENVTFPLRAAGRRRYGKNEIYKRAKSALETVGLKDLETRPATQLSGGQQQRLALARAIIHDPSLILLDEPLSNLDVKLREEMRIELKRLQRNMGVTALYVTHDQTEALALSDTIAVMRDGQIVQTGSPDAIYNQPINRFVAEFIGTTNVLPATVIALGSGQIAVKVLDRLHLECPVSSTAPGVGSSLLVSLRPEAVEITKMKPGLDVQGSLRGRVATVTFLGSTIMYSLEVQETIILALAPPGLGISENDLVDITASRGRAVALF